MALNVDVETLSIKVTEEIKPKYVIKFLRSSILDSDLDIDTKSSFYYYFIKDALLYEILIFIEKPNSLQIPFLLKNYIDTSCDKNYLFYNHSFMVLYLQNKLVVYKEIDNISQNDLIIYVEQIYKESIDKSIFIDETFLQTLNHKKIKKDKKFQFFSILPNHSYSVFLTFFFIVVSLFSYLIYEKITYNNSLIALSNQDRELRQKYINLQNIYKSENIQIIKKMKLLFKYIKLNKIQIETIIYQNSKFRTKLIQQNRDNLLHFINGYKKHTKVKSIKYSNDKKAYVMDIIIDV